MLELHGVEGPGRIRPLLVACALGGLLACGGGNDVTPPTPSPTPLPAPVRSVVTQGSFSINGPEADGTTYFVRVSITSTAAGTFETTVDWTYATNTLWMYIAEGECTVDQFASDDCPGPACACRFTVTSEDQAPKPRVLTVPTASAGTRTLVVWNLGPREDACSYQAVLTRTVGALTAAGRAGASFQVSPKRAPVRRLEAR